MDNKNEKTFADLFSSSTSANELNAKDELTHEETNNNKENTITFDSLFDRSTSQEKEEKKESLQGFNNLLEKSSTAENENSIIDNHEQPIEKKIQEENIFLQATDSLYQNPTKSKNIFDVSFSNSNKDTEEASFPQEKNKEINLNKNLFFQEKSTIDETSTSNLPIESTSKINEPSKETKIANSIFFENSNKEEIKNEEVQKTKENIEKKDSNNHLEEPNIIENINPFFQEKESNSDESSTPNLSIEPKEFLDKINTSEKETEIENLIFFENSKEEEIKKEAIPDEKENIEEKDPINNLKENNKVTSTSPFFQEEESRKIENPFFENKINLVENIKHETKLKNIDTSKSKHFDVKIVKKKDPLPKFILGVISYAIFIWLLLIGITLLVYVLDIKIRAAKGDYSSPKFNAYVVLTGSMLPDIQVYDVVVTKKVEAESLKEGDIITFASADSRFLGTIITHRIIKKNYDAETKTYNFQTQGDNNNVADSALVPQNNIYGKVILKVPKLGYLQEFLASDGGWIIVILIPCLTVISYDIVKLIKGLKRKNYKNIKVQK